MIDSSRHFMPVDVIERNLDAMAAGKLNVFYWHLSENQGFRIESKKFPKLQEMGADGLYYTQEQIRDIIAYAHERGIRVVPLVGPSSLLLALMASGLNGQRFCFHGYLPVERDARSGAIRVLEAQSRSQRCAQLFIEAPYRNDALFSAIIATCRPETWFSLAVELTGPAQHISTQRIRQWREAPAPQLHKRPAVFLLLAARSSDARRPARNAH